MIVRTADFSPCEKYRYHLGRQWNADLPLDCFIMLNPSTADAFQDDPTIRKVMKFTAGWGAGGVDILNIFAWRSPYPDKLRYVEDPVGKENDARIRHCVAANGYRNVVCAWGGHGEYLDRGKAVMAILRDLGVTPLALKVSDKTRQPYHPLYLRDDTQPFPYAG